MICFLKVFEARTLDLLYSLLRETVSDFIFLGSKIAADGDCMKLKDAYSLEGKL